VSALNSLTGRLASDDVGFDIFPQSDGNYVVRSPYCKNGSIAIAGAISIASGVAPTTGTVQSSNTAFGAKAGAGITLNYAYDPSRQRLFVGRPQDGIVTIISLDEIFGDGFE